MANLKIKKENLRPFFLPLVLAVLFLSSSLLILIPKGKQVIALRKENQKEKEKLAELVTKAKVLEELSATDLPAKIEVSLRVLPAENDTLHLLATLEQVGVEQGLLLKRFSLDEGFLLNCTFEGGVNNLKTFTIALGKVLPLLVIEKAKFITRGDKLEAEFSLRGFTLPIEEKIEMPEEVLPLSEEEEEMLEEFAQDYYSFTKWTSLEATPSTGTRRNNPFSF